jgi:hypothetical protein
MANGRQWSIRRNGASAVEWTVSAAPKSTKDAECELELATLTASYSSRPALSMKLVAAH